MKKIISFLTGILISTNLFAFQPNEIVLGYSPGGPTDTVIRTLIAAMPKNDYVVIHKPGGAGALGLVQMKERNSLSLIVAENVFVSNPILYGNKLPYKLEDIDILGVLALNPQLLVCRSDLNFKKVDDIANYSGNLNFAVAGQGGIEELTTRLLFRKIGKTHTIINYPAGGNKQFLDILGGHSDCIFGNLPSVMPFVTNTKITPIMSTYNIDRIVKNIPHWETVYKEQFPIHLSVVLVSSKQFPEEAKEKVISDFKSVFEKHTTKETLLQRGFFPIGEFGINAERFNTLGMKRFSQTLTDLQLNIK